MNIEDSFRESKIIQITWSVEDVMEHAKTIGVEISEAEAMEILLQLYHSHDATVGINWDVIGNAITESKAKRMSFVLWCVEVERLLNEYFGISTNDIASIERLEDWYKDEATSPMCFVNAMEIKYDLVKVKS